MLKVKEMAMLIQRTKTSPQCDPQTLAAYSALAPEYGNSEHATTRSLEAASNRALSSIATKLFHRSPARVLELGCGHGASSAQIMRSISPIELTVSDPVPEMLSRASSNLESFSGRTVFEQSDATEALFQSGDTELVIAALADPYLDQDLLDHAFTVLRPRTRMFLSVPSRDWALRERTGRLGVPIDKTRFRLRDGSFVECRSNALSPRKLGAIVTDAGMELIASGSLFGPEVHNLETEISWAVCEKP